MKGVFSMKNFTKLKAVRMMAGIIALVAVIGFSFAACGDDDGGGGGGGGGGGRFTLTDIPAEYNGKYAMLKTYRSGNLMGGFQEGGNPVYPYYNNATLPSISNGSVSIPMYTLDSSIFLSDWVRYSGNDTVEKVTIEIYNSSTSNSYKYPWDRVFDSVTFTNGNVQKSWKDGKDY
jgi:hypothetical protein